MTTIPTERNQAPHGIEDQGIEDLFLELVLADEQLLRAEFDAIVTQEWPSRPPPPAPRKGGPTPPPAPRRPLVPPARRVRLRPPGRPQAGGRRRQRSPP
jgi:hypothetical protein